MIHWKDFSRERTLRLMEDQAMTRTLILNFHPAPDDSRANRALASAAGGLPGVQVVEMQTLYPNGAIDTDIEAARLLAVDRLILQFPVQWYSAPPLLKVWQNTLLTRMYYMAAETEGDRLVGMPVMVAATAGNTPAAYTPEGANGFPLEDLMLPLRATAHRCGWLWAPPFLVHEANRSTPATLAAEADRYVAAIMAWAKPALAA